MKTFARLKSDGPTERNANMITAEVQIRLRRELVSYLNRLVVSPELAEDLAQDCFARAIGAADSAPEEATGYRRWMFRIATNLAIDALRQRRRRSEIRMLDLREDVENDPAFVQLSTELVGTPETATIAAEHLAVCFSCTLTHLSERKAAALLLTEVHGFSVEEVAEALGATFNQAKNAIQEARRSMLAKYNTTCALIAKGGVCHQCDELAEFFDGDAVKLGRESDKWQARMRVLKDLRLRTPGVWHTLLLGRVRSKMRAPPGKA